MRHLRWIVPAVIGVAVFAVLAVVVPGLSSRPDPATGLLVLVLAAVWLVVPLVCLILTLVQAVGVARSGRRERERRAADEQARAESERWRQVAVAWRRRLRAGERLEEVPVWPVVLRPGEVAHADLSLTYARYYGTPVSYQPGSTLAFGRPGFVAAVMVADAIGNSQRRATAQRLAAQQWRELQPTRVVLTDQRVLCELGGSWLTFDFSAMGAIWPDAAGGTFVAAFGATEPLWLSGPGVELVGVLAVAALHGPRGLTEHPGLQALDAVDAGPPGPGDGAAGTPRTVGRDGPGHVVEADGPPGRAPRPSIFDT